jgi:hypothetical protein
MEQLLNCVGLLVALAIVGAWLRLRRVNQRGPSHSRLLWQVLALSLVVLFLFFAISISDDLHWNAIATEAEGSRKIVKTLASKASASPPGLSTTAILLMILLLFVARRISSVDRLLPIGSPAVGFSNEFSGRAPPLVS